jgi:hypothetical protein
MSLIDSVWTLSDKFLKDARMVSIDDSRIVEIAEYVKNWIGEKHCVAWGFPKCINSKDKDAIQDLFLYEIIANSVNYCYWFGRYDVRPNEANCALMYKLLGESFDKLHEMQKTAQFHPSHEVEIIIDAFIEKLNLMRFPLVDHRIKHLKEVQDSNCYLRSFIEAAVQREDYRAEEWLKILVTTLPGYSKDLFLKRAMLFIMQMYRRCRLFENDIGKVLIPADYQIPKMLRWLGCTNYSEALAYLVDNNIPLPENGQAECEIRATTIQVSKRIAELANCTSEAVDSYLFNRRYDCKEPFHLVITTNY